MFFSINGECCVYLTNVFRSPALGGPFLLSRLSLSPICRFLPPRLSLSSFWASLEGMTISIYGRSLDSAIHTGSRRRHRGMF